MKFKTIISLSLVFIITNCFAQNQSSSYSNFKTGTFTIEGQSKSYEMKRSNDKQIESFNDGKSKIICSIHWTNDSTYVLKVIKITNAPGCVKVGEKMTTTLSGCSSKKVNCSISSQKCGNAKGVIIKIK